MPQKTVLITGCSEGGIGDALAKEFHKKGVRVFATARNLTKVEHLKALGLDILPLDVTDEASIKAAVESVKAITGGTLDILVNNSGGGYNLPLLDTDVPTAKRMFDVNIFGLISVTQAFTPLLIASKGTIVNIGSVAGIAPVPWQGYYNASKAGVNLLTDQLRLELAPWNVKCILVVTGGIKTKFFENLPTPTTIPEGSQYYPARDIIEPYLAGSIVDDDGIEVDIYARSVVANALKANPTKHHWIGGSTTVTWLANTFLWSTVWDLALVARFDLNSVYKKIWAAEKKE